MNYCDYLFYDFETGSANPHRCQPIQLACVPIHGRKLEIIEDTFCSLIQPVFNLEECDKYNLDPISDEALEINKIKREDLEKAPPLKFDSPELEAIFNDLPKKIQEQMKGRK